MVVDVLHPGKATVSKADVSAIIIKDAEDSSHLALKISRNTINTVLCSHEV